MGIEVAFGVKGGHMGKMSYYQYRVYNHLTNICNWFICIYKKNEKEKKKEEKN